MQPDSWQPTPEEVNTRREKNEPLVAWWRGHVAQPWSPARLWTERGEVYGDFYGTRVLARSMGGLWGGWAFTPDEIGYIQGGLDVERDRNAKAEREFEEADLEAGRRLGEVRRERDRLAAENAALWSRCEAMGAALAPFAATAAEIPADVNGDQLIIKVGNGPEIVIGDLRACQPHALAKAAEVIQTAHPLLDEVKEEMARQEAEWGEHNARFGLSDWMICMDRVARRVPVNRPAEARRQLVKLAALTLRALRGAS